MLQEVTSNDAQIKVLKALFDEEADKYANRREHRR